MSKPKTGKMTDKEFNNRFNAGVYSHRVDSKSKDKKAMTDEEYDKILDRATNEYYKEKQEGMNGKKVKTNFHHFVIDVARAEGRADVISQLSGEKKITVEVLNEAKRQGGEKAVADFKAKLLNYSKGNVVYGYSMKSRQIISDAIKEAEKK